MNFLCKWRGCLRSPKHLSKHRPKYLRSVPVRGGLQWTRTDLQRLWHLFALSWALTVVIRRWAGSNHPQEHCCVTTEFSETQQHALEIWAVRQVKTKALWCTWQYTHRKSHPAASTCTVLSANYISINLREGGNGCLQTENISECLGRNVKFYLK